MCDGDGDSVFDGDLYAKSKSSSMEAQMAERSHIPTIYNLHETSVLTRSRCDGRILCYVPCGVLRGVEERRGPTGEPVRIGGLSRWTVSCGAEVIDWIRQLVPLLLLLNDLCLLHPLRGVGHFQCLVHCKEGRGPVQAVGLRGVCEYTVRSNERRGTRHGNQNEHQVHGHRLSDICNNNLVNNVGTPSGLAVPIDSKCFRTYLVEGAG